MRVRAAVLEFLRGLTTPSPAAGAAMLATIPAVCVVLALVVTPRFVARHGYAALARGPADDDAHLLQSILRLHTGTAGHGGPHVLVLGSSSDREMIASAPALANGIGAVTGRAPDVHLLTSSGQSLVESAVLLEMLPAGVEGVIVIGMKLERVPRFDEVFRPEAGGRRSLACRLGFRSAFGDRAMRARGVTQPPRTGLYLLDNVAFLWPRGAALVSFLASRSGPRFEAPHWYLETPPLDAAGMAERRERIRDRLARATDARVEEDLATLAEAIRAVRARGRVELVLLRSLAHPRYGTDILGAERDARFTARLHAFAAEQEAHVWDMRAGAGLTEADFHDWSHLRTPEAMERCTAVLAARIGALLTHGGNA
jgi:hypothetical protein